MARVLVVDDRDVNREYLNVLLGYAGHSVTEAADGLEALASARSQCPDLVIADILMPTMDGYEFVRQLRTDPRFNSTPVIFYSANYLEHEACALAQSCGVQHVITKPSPPQVILETVAAALTSGVPAAGIPPAEQFDRDHIQVLTNRLSRSAEELRSTSDKFAILLDLTRRFAAPEDEGSVLERTCADARVIVGAKHCVIGLLQEEDKNRFQHVVSGTMHPAVREALKDICLRDSAFQSVIGNCSPRRFSGLSGDARALGLPEGHPGVHTLLAVPIATSRIYGVLYLAERIGRDEFSDEDENLAGSLAAQLAVWCENQALVSSLKKRTSELERGIEERNAIEEQLRQSQRLDALGQLAGGISHDFNNLLTVILGFGVTATEDLDPLHPSQDSLREILNAAERAAALVRRILVFSRRQIIRPKAVQLNAILADMKNMLVRTLGEQIDIVVSPASDLSWIEADPGQLEQVLMNLFVNARDAMPLGGRLEVETRNQMLDEPLLFRALEISPGPYAVLSVRDSGTGITPDVLPRIFDPFFTTKDPAKGTGLGLATVYGIVRQSGGAIKVDSRVGVGTSFEVYFPAIAPPHDVPAALPAQRSREAGAATILLVEDEPAVRRLTAALLRQNGHTVLVAGCATEAISLCDGYPDSLDLLITDVVMPAMSGVELAAMICQRQPAIRVLYMSGYASEVLARCGPLPQGSIFVEKPFTPEVFISHVQEALSAMCDYSGSAMAPQIPAKAPWL